MNAYIIRFSIILGLCMVLGYIGCTTTTKQSQTMPGIVQADTNNGNIILPVGFGAAVVADDLGRVRHVAVRDNGDIFVKVRKLTEEGHGIIGLRDSDGDGRADERVSFGDFVGTGIHIYNNYLYASSDTGVYRYAFNGDALQPSATREDIAIGFIKQGQHEGKSFTIDDSGNLFVNVGAPSNACQEKAR
ncbi:MAG: sorbosone dehydrogenase, partial [Bacteroidota bacterium]